MLHFTASEFHRRQAGLEAALAKRHLDGILLFAPESHYWLTGYDTFGFCFFQCLVIGGSEPVLLTRSADRHQARITSRIRDIRIWVDHETADPSRDLLEILTDLGLVGKRLGIETNTHGLTGMSCQRVYGHLEGTVHLVEASDLVPSLRLVKSDEEMVYVRKAAALADDALDAALECCVPGTDEGEILAAMQSVIFRGGGDYPGNEFIIGSGESAMLVRYAAGNRSLSANDQLNLEWAGVYRRYHVAMMRTVVIGTPQPGHKTMHTAATEALLACEEQLRPGICMEDVYATHCRILEHRNMGSMRLNACGYALGARFTPTWMEPQMFRAGAKTVIRPGMVFFLHMILLDSEQQIAMCPGRTSLVTDSGSECLSRHRLELLIR
ncbi:MAG: Xaa-Pro peptidase family protein [Rhodobacteraceae bacterium]|nr:Xaa-Pro peptidase family protein [Paracoccaceae bacterium]